MSHNSHGHGFERTCRSRYWPTLKVPYYKGIRSMLAAE